MKGGLYYSSQTKEYGIYAFRELTDPVPTYAKITPENVEKLANILTPNDIARTVHILNRQLALDPRFFKGLVPGLPQNKQLALSNLRDYLILLQEAKPTQRKQLH